MRRIEGDLQSSRSRIALGVIAETSRKVEQLHALAAGAAHRIAQEGVSRRRWVRGGIVAAISFFSACQKTRKAYQRGMTGYFLLRPHTDGLKTSRAPADRHQGSLGHHAGRIVGRRNGCQGHGEKRGLKLRKFNASPHGFNEIFRQSQTDTG